VSSVCYPNCNQGEADKKHRRDALTGVSRSTPVCVPHYCMSIPDGKLLIYFFF